LNNYKTGQDRNTRRHPYHQFIVFQRLKERAEIEEEETNKIEFSRFYKIMLQKNFSFWKRNA
jgi:hypothetical protein